MGQHKYNPTAQAAKAGELPLKPPRRSSAEVKRIIAGAVAAATGVDRLLAAAHGQFPDEYPAHPQTDPPRKIETWEELDGLVSRDGRYKIRVELDHGCGYIEPTFEVPDGEYWDHHEYLSTHTFYEKTHKMYTDILQRFGFNVELVSWG